MNKYVEKWVESSLILKILIGLIIGAILGLAVPQYEMIGLLGQLFVSALKAIAPLLVDLEDCPPVLEYTSVSSTKMFTFSLLIKIFYSK